MPLLQRRLHTARYTSSSSSEMFLVFLHASPYLQPLEHPRDIRTQVHRRLIQLLPLEHPQTANCKHGADTSAWFISFSSLPCEMLLLSLRWYLLRLSVPWLYSWQTNASASAKTLSSSGQCSPWCSTSFNKLSKIFKADCLPIPANGPVVSQPVMVWKASGDFLFSLDWTVSLCSKCTGEHPNFLTEILSVRQKEGLRTSVSWHNRLTW